MIGQGLQFSVFDEGVRVRKKPNSNRDIVRLLARSNIQSVVNPLGLGREARRIARERDEVVREFGRRQFDKTIVANAEIRGRTIVQDKVLTFGEVLRADENHYALIDRLVEFTKACWAQGVCETTFNFTVNHGVTEEGRVVIIDIGELTFDRDVAVRHIRERFWEKAWSFTSDLDDNVREYVAHAFSDRLTEKVLVETWVDAPIIGSEAASPSNSE
ncbi:MAG: hypothetical protein HKN13_11330 [Rhodothermales bacterium]|nr:hypothetical protein [Rhodothermales bacterium]